MPSNLCYAILHLERDPLQARAAQRHVMQLHAKHEALVDRRLQELDLRDADGRRLAAALTGLGARWSETAVSVPVDKRAARFVVAQYAPQGLLPGCVLQNMANA
jgi:hypothetical protein